MAAFLRKLKKRRIWERIFLERLTEPIHLNLMSTLVFLFGTYKQKVGWDLVIRHHNAYGILKAADYARELGLQKVSLLECGVASGAGLFNIRDLAARTEKATGIQFQIYGFDTGHGMPPARDYRDHPDLYQEGDFTTDISLLKKSCSPNTKLLIGEMNATVPEFLSDLKESEPIGFASIDVDYYYSAKDALKIFQANPKKYLPTTILYFDDIHMDAHNSYCGELLAIREFNEENKFRKIERHPFFENSRVFERASWIKHIYQLHVLDHPIRACVENRSESRRVLDNPYL